MVLNHWDEVPAMHRRWIFINSILIAAVWNVAINGLGALIAVHARHHVPLWSTPVIGGPNLILNPMETLFFLPFSTCLGVTSAVRKATRVGLLVLAAGGPVVILIMAVGFGGGISTSAYVIYSALFGLFLGLTVTSYIALAAMGDYEDTKK
jgi:hypothetical protein